MGGHWTELTGRPRSPTLNPKTLEDPVPDKINAAGLEDGIHVVLSSGYIGVI